MTEDSPIPGEQETLSPVLRFSQAMRVHPGTPTEMTDRTGPAEPPDMEDPSVPPEPESSDVPPPRDKTAPVEDEMPIESRLDAIEARMEKLAERFDQLEFVIVEQFEPGMTQPDEHAGGNLRERLDRIEVALGLISQASADDGPEAAAGDTDGPAIVAAAIDDRLATISSQFADMLTAERRRSEATDAAADRLSGLERAVDTMTAETERRQAEMLEALEGLAHRPPPAPDLTLQHRSFAGFAAALQTTLQSFEESVGGVLGRLDDMNARIESLASRLSDPSGVTASDVLLAPATSALETSIANLSDRIGTLAEVLGARQGLSEGPEITALAARLEQLGTFLAVALGKVDNGSRGELDEALRDLRIAVAEIAAENRRLRIA